MTLVRSIAAVLAGFVLVLVGHTATDYALAAVGVFPALDKPFADQRLFLIALGHRMAWQVLAGWLTAFIAPSRPMLHAMILAALGLLGAIGGAVAMWGVGPAWYPIALAVSVVPTLWLGARLRQAQLSGRRAAV
jgi:hypothetical protein